MINRVKPGMHPSIELKIFNVEELNIVKALAKEWYVTRSGIISLGQKSEYKYLLIKPTEKYSELFNFELEIVACFSSYSSFEPRALDTFDLVYSRNSDFRIEKSITILLSKDDNVIERLRDILKKDQEYQVIVPFSYTEILKNDDPFFIRNRFKDFFYSRDLFSFQNPLKKDFYFFGRKDLIHNIVNRHNSNENSGLFGLRKTGKTSIVYGVQRVLKNSGQISVYIDCQNPSFHISRWNNALWFVINALKTENNLTCKIHSDSEYTKEKASLFFAKDIITINKKAKGKILIIFDEIEHITYGVSPSPHWRNDNDFLFFWQSLRSIYQSNQDIFSYLIVGTNPKCVELPSINGTDNPIFNQIAYQYIPAFDLTQTKEMVSKLGGIMGLKFDDIIYGKLTEDFGGHPFLIRLVCSQIHKIVQNDRPARVDKSVYEVAKQNFELNYSSYIEMVINVLHEYYPDEYEMLTMLAIGNKQQFQEFATIPEYTSHLLGYNILDKNNNVYTFKIETLKNYLENKNRYSKIHLTKQEKLKEISERRNTIEPKLRKIIRSVFISKFGEAEAKKKILSILGASAEHKYYAYSLKEVLDPNKAQIYFEDLRKIISKHWDEFKHIFGNDNETFNSYMKNINKYRADAHAKDISDDEMSEFRISASKIEKFIKDFLEE
ncbi:hypothetical protein [uncultured Bacteroides sp.]|uniref:hypothetical protein n=1 Tax=uncultured Bacteroides sp. TaxID=162156 RepID=UPI00259A6889|nr:hypothetical protein [uncultured Bacteroides sp.]